MAMGFRVIVLRHAQFEPGESGLNEDGKKRIEDVGKWLVSALKLNPLSAPVYVVGISSFAPETEATVVELGKRLGEFDICINTDFLSREQWSLDDPGYTGDLARLLGMVEWSRYVARPFPPIVVMVGRGNFPKFFAWYMTEVWQRRSRGYIVSKPIKKLLPEFPNPAFCGFGGGYVVNMSGKTIQSIPGM